MNTLNNQPSPDAKGGNVSPMQWFGEGYRLQNLQQHEAALACFDRALELKPKFSAARHNRATLLHTMRRLDEARSEFESLCDEFPNIAEAHCNLGALLIDQEEYEAAVERLQQALAVNGELPQVYLNLGLALQKLERHDEALDAFKRVIALKPDEAYTVYCSGISLKELGRHDEALAAFEQTLAYDPDNADALARRAVLLCDTERKDEALADLDRAIELQPDHVSAHLNKALLLMSLGDYVKAWPEYEWRKQFYPKYYPQWPGKTLWLGQTPLTNKSILLHQEQGLGDFIQFCRYAPLLAEQGARVILQTPASMMRLASTLPGAPQLLRCGDDPLSTGFDYYTPLMSLPLAFGTTLANVPADVPYLACESGVRQRWCARLAQTGHPVTSRRIGLAWSGSTSYPGDQLRSIQLASLVTILRLPFEFHALQKEIRPEDEARLGDFPNLSIHCKALNDFGDTAALIDAMDLVISVDTAVAHLAGALGKPLWILLSSTPEFRWLQNARHTPWYPSATFWRQKLKGDWQPVIDAVAAQLLKIAA